jgi:hypothetical protein
MARKDMPTRKPETGTGATETAQLAEVVPTHDQVRHRAYEIYDARCHNGACGDALADWIAAEAELKVGSNGHEQVARIGSESGRSET